MSKPEVTNVDVKIEQPDPKTLPGLGEPITDDDQRMVMQPAGGYTPEQERKYYDDLKFNEEPVTIVIQGSQEGDNFNCTDFVSVNGTHAQVLMNNQWVECAFLPKNQEIVVKRKVLDTLLRAKRNKVTTSHENIGEGHMVNKIHQQTFPVLTVSLIEDKNPRGKEWFKRRMASNY